MKNLRQFREDVLLEGTEYVQGNAKVRSFFEAGVHPAWVGIYDYLFKQIGIRVRGRIFTGIDAKGWSEARIKGESDDFDNWLDRHAQGLIDNQRGSVKIRLEKNNGARFGTMFESYDCFIDGRNEGEIKFEMGKKESLVILLARRRSEFKAAVAPAKSSSAPHQSKPAQQKPQQSQPKPKSKRPKRF